MHRAGGLPPCVGTIESDMDRWTYRRFGARRRLLVFLHCMRDKSRRSRLGC